MLNYRSEALPKLTSLAGKNLYELANDFGTLISLGGKKNKGWVGQTLEQYLGLTETNLQRMDGNDYELKSTSLVRRAGIWIPKETIKITQLNPKHILSETFETSALWTKCSRLIFVGVFHESETICRTVRVSAIDMTDSKLVDEVRTFWNDVQSLVANGEMKDFVNFGNSEGLVQLRPTGNGKYFSTCPITGDKYPARAFYATKRLISLLIN